MANTFRKLQKRIENKDGSYTYEPLSYVGIDNIPLDIMKGATSSSDGVIGLVPKPSKGNTNRYLRADGIWATPSNYSHPSYNQYSNGLYKITTDELGHVVEATPVTKDDITALGIPGQDTTYGLASTANDGLMSAADKSDITSLKTSLDQTQKTIINNVNGIDKKIKETEVKVEKLHAYVDNQIDAINNKIAKINEKIAKYHS